MLNVSSWFYCTRQFHLLLYAYMHIYDVYVSPFIKRLTLWTFFIRFQHNQKQLQYLPLLHLNMCQQKLWIFQPVCKPVSSQSMKLDRRPSYAQSIVSMMTISYKMQGFAVLCILMFFQITTQWMPLIRSCFANDETKVPVVLVGNKLDLVSNSKMEVSFTPLLHFSSHILFIV